MSSSPQPPLVACPGPGVIRRWTRTWRVLLLLPALGVTLVVMFYAEENWRGWHAWNQYRQTLVARGEQLDLKQFIPAPIPKEKNFAAIPLVESWFQKPARERWDDDYTQFASEVTASTTDAGGQRQMLDLAIWAMAFDPTWPGDWKVQDRESRKKAAAAVLQGLKSSEAPLAELRTASQRPLARYPVVYDLENPWGILLPHLANVKKACQRLQLRACAELASDQRGPALDDVKLMFYLADSLNSEPFLISHLVRIACLQLAIQPIWEGLAEQRWSNSDLQTLQALLQQRNFVASAQRAIQSEQAAGIYTIELVRKKGLTYLWEIQNQGSVPPAGKVLAAVLGTAIPRGWYYQEELNYCRYHHQLIGKNLDPEQKRIFLSNIEQNTQASEQAIKPGNGPAQKLQAILDHRFLTGFMLPPLAQISTRAAQAQVATDEAALACALEQYRLANGSFPDSLQELQPRFISSLPKDVLTGELYQFRRTENGRFELFSLPANEIRTGGTGNGASKQKPGGWFWRYPAKG